MTSTFMEHARSCGLIMRDLQSDNRWHRVPTTDHPKKRNGSYIFDGRHGAAMNWGTMSDPAGYSEGTEAGTIVRVPPQATTPRESDEERQERARKAAATMIRRCGRAPHPYLTAKGFPRAVGLINEHRELVIPMRDMRDYSTVNTLQCITPTGEKRFLPGGKAKGSVLSFACPGWRERWLVEGYATGLSVQAALRDLRRKAEVIVCFSAGNLVHVASWLRFDAASRVGKQWDRLLVFADNDASGTGAAAADQTGLKWTMPDVVGMDANDAHLKLGLRSVVQKMLTIS